MSLLLFNPRTATSNAQHPTTSRAFRMGASLHPNRAAYEFYPTPPEATRALLAAHRFEGDIWEPACGQGHIAKVLSTAGYAVVPTDLVDYGYGEPNRDFLAESRPRARNIITNPPYGRGLADAFVKHALALTERTGGTVAMLVAVQSLCHPSRHDFYTSRPPAVIYALDDCTCWPNGVPTSHNSSIAKQRDCWMVWTPGHRGPTTFQWLTTRPFRDQSSSPPILLKRAA